MIKVYFLQLLFFVAVVIVIEACKQQYEPPIIQSGLSALVVDGFLNNSSDTTVIRLSHTQKLSDGVKNSQEQGAHLSVEDAGGNALYNFVELNDSGVYIVPGMNLDLNSKYRLRIVTANGKEYVSDEIAVIKTPPIDSVSWGKTNKSIAIYANTHDPKNTTRYYRWEYIESWQYHAAYFSGLISENGGLRERLPAEDVYECWKTQRSTQLLLGTSAKLADDIIFQLPLRLSDLDGIEFSEKYFIYLKQFALSKESYQYLENLKKITEQTGSIFDAQPSQVIGNIHAVKNTDEIVLGYLTASTMEGKVRFITNDEVQPWNYDPRCVLVEVPPDPPSILNAFSQNSLIPLAYDGGPYNLKGIFATTYHCGDCTALGGVTIKPDFWQ